MTAATIVSMDIEGFSRRGGAEQRRLMESLTGETLYLLRRWITPLDGPPGVVVLPTGDGMVVVFLHGVCRDWDFDTVMRFILRLQSWGCRQGESSRADCQALSDPPYFGMESVGKEPVRIRAGVHVGVVEPLIDIHGRFGVCGNAVSLAQRIMESADGGQLLFSLEAYSEYWGERERYRAEFCGRQLELLSGGVADVRMHYDLPLQMVQIHPAGNHPCWSSQPPVSFSNVLVRTVRYGDFVMGEYGDRLRKARRIAIVQGRGGWLFDPERFRLHESINKDVESIWIFITGSDGSNDMESEQRHRWKSAVEGWKNAAQRLTGSFLHADVKVYVVGESVPYSISYLDWECQGGRIDVNPSIAGGEQEGGPVMELEWFGKTAPALYGIYARSLNEIRSRARPVDVFSGGGWSGSRGC